MPGQTFALLASKAAEIVFEAWQRQSGDNAHHSIQINDQSLSVLQQVVDGFTHGTSLAHLSETINKLISNQEQRAELISSLVMSHEYNRLVKYLAVRSHLEDQLIEAALRDDLSTSEKLMLLKLVGDETQSVANKVQAGSTTVKDIMGLMNKVDYKLQLGERTLGSKFRKTTPQGREIVRRVAFQLQRTIRETVN